MFWWVERRWKGPVFAANGKRRFSRRTKNGFIYTFAYSQEEADRNFNWRYVRDFVKPVKQSA